MKLFRNKTDIRKKGFTLVELLVVISIIGLLASVVLATISTARRHVRDNSRLSDMKSIELALELYWQANNVYPGTTAQYGENTAGSPSCGGWDVSFDDKDGDGILFIDPLVEGGFISKVPVDPQNTGACGVNGQAPSYAYYLYNAGTSGCDPAKGRFFVLGIRDTEGSPRPHPDSPGWSCLNRDWQSEFDWVTGGFE
jgi:prepilin-type N-terminal cleavage/methylation domain-containing protein